MWLEHELQFHHHEWSCDGPHDSELPVRTFSSATGLREHFLEEHRGLFEESQLPFLVERGKYESLIPYDNCPFCHCTLKDMEKNISKGIDHHEPVHILSQRLQKHIGDHIRNFSFFAFLENQERDDVPKSDQMTAQKSEPHSESDSDFSSDAISFAAPETEEAFQEESIPELQLEVEWEPVRESTQEIRNMPLLPEDDEILATFLARSLRGGEPSLGKPVCILSLDGGLQGLSALYILRELMEQVALLHRAENPQKPGISPRPCEYFDLICGASMGGLIALMLGRLRMVSAMTFNFDISLLRMPFQYI